MLGSILHWLTCPHKDVHQLPPPESLKLCDWTLTHGEKLWHPWTEATIQHRRIYSLSYLLPLRSEYLRLVRLLGGHLSIGVVA